MKTVKAIVAAAILATSFAAVAAPAEAGFFRITWKGR